MSELLEKINKPNDIKNIDKKDYPKLAEEIREFLIDSVSKTGGHLASNAMPPLKAPSPITATIFSSVSFSSAAVAIPRAAEMDVEL